MNFFIMTSQAFTLGVPAGDAAERALSELFHPTHAAPLQALPDFTTGHQLTGFSFDHTPHHIPFDLDAVFKLQDGALDPSVPVSSALDFNSSFDYSATPFPFFPSPPFTSSASPASSISSTAALGRSSAFESPLDDPTYSDFLVSPMFSETSDSVLDSYPSLFPAATPAFETALPAEREIAKRLAQAEVDKAPAPEIPDDLVAAVEKKRLLNTICARKSRQRKQERLGELEVENKGLVEENEGLKLRLAELEGLLKSLGAQV
ncbi:hypothetical protein RQP46_005879 [Phenoliferia psychrophenolica]